MTIRPLGASEVDAPGSSRACCRDGAAVVDVTARSATAAPRGRSSATGRLGGARRSRSRRSRSAAGARRRCARSCASPHPDLWAPGHPGAADAPARRPGRVRLAVEASACASCAGRAGACCSTARRSRCAARRSRRTPQGRGDALRPDDMDAIVRRLQRDRRERDARAASAEPGAARAPRRRRHPRLAGRRPGRLARRVDARRRRRCAPGGCAACASTSCRRGPTRAC